MSPAAPAEPQTPRCVVAVGDVHGRLDLLDAMLARVREDFDGLAPGAPAPLLLFLGDLVDRGPDSAACLGRVSHLSRHGPFPVLLLKGNHEQWFGRFLDDPAAGPRWARFGGDATLRSYGVEPPGPEGDVRDWVEARLKLLAAVPPSDVAFLGALPTRHLEGDYLFVHAGVRPGRALEAQSEEDLLWIRDPFLRSKQPSRYVVVHGHTPSRAPDLLPWRIGLDTEAWRSGRLSGVRLEGIGQALMEVRGPSAAEAGAEDARGSDGGEGAQARVSPPAAPGPAPPP